jgi:hypothetical protein
MTSPIPIDAALGSEPRCMITASQSVTTTIQSVASTIKVGIVEHIDSGSLTVLLGGNGGDILPTNNVVGGLAGSGRRRIMTLLICVGSASMLIVPNAFGATLGTRKPIITIPMSSI